MVFGFLVFGFLLALLIFSAVALVRTSMNRRPGVDPWDSRFLYNPNNLVFFGREHLTEKGLFWRNLFWLSLALFIGTLLLALLLKHFLWRP
jgi:hypothetical protein